MQALSPWFRTVRLVRGIRQAFRSAEPTRRPSVRRVFKIVREPRPQRA
jgi:hypothetical protein